MLTTEEFKKVSRIIIVAQCLGMMAGALFQNSFYLNYLAARGLDSPRIAMLMPIPLFVTMLLAIPFAYLSDRMGKKRTSIWGQILTAAGIFILIPEIPWATAAVVTAFSVMSIGGSLQAGAWLALLSPIVPEKIRGRFFSRLRVAFQICMIVFSFIISRLLKLNSGIPVFQGVLVFVVITNLFRIQVFNRIPELETPHHEPPKQRHIFAALKAVLQHMSYRRLNSYVFLSTLFTASAPTLFGLLEKDILLFTPARISLMGTLLVTGGMIGCWIGGHLVDRYGAMKMFVLGHIGYITILISVLFREWAAWSSVIHMSLVSILFSISGGIVGISVGAETLALMPRDNKSLAGAFNGTAMSCAGALSGFAIASLLEHSLLPSGWTLLGKTFSAYDSILLTFAGGIALLLIVLRNPEKNTDLPPKNSA
ncbi:MFS transporter [Tichowtungia aerotolerans]|uniref:MFS transporter n=1 Tax=Tichowtungia aerotolerans TaxID=2697043 RepID=A0A6P1M5F4_9BACT|nr:MFS transporter [Tichowtungia aerotolerans]QHI70019.1 MFS transporter [Tichowtungia aerotolerans]